MVIDVANNPFADATKAMKKLGEQLKGNFSNSDADFSKLSFKHRAKKAFISFFNAFISFVRDVALVAVLILLCMVLASVVIIFVKHGFVLSTEEIFSVLFLCGAGALLSMVYKSL